MPLPRLALPWIVLGPQGTAKWTQHAIPVQVMCDRSRRFAGKIVEKNAANDASFRFTDASCATLLIASFCR